MTKPAFIGAGFTIFNKNILEDMDPQSAAVLDPGQIRSPVTDPSDAHRDMLTKFARTSRAA
jgi:hypothetical protein